MKVKKKYGIFIFHRDFRIYDNTSLIELGKVCDEVIACFIYDPEQLKRKGNSSNAIQFMVESLKDLDEQLRGKGSRLYAFYGKPEVVLKKVVKDRGIGGSDNIVFVGYNYDYTPYAMKRDDSIDKLCEKMGIEIICYEDYMLDDVESVVSGSGKPYKVFNAYYKTAKKINKRKINKSRVRFIGKGVRIAGEYKKNLWDSLYEYNDELLVKGGRVACFKLIQSAVFRETIKNYARRRDIPEFNTSLLSAYIKFGCISIRELYWHLVRMRASEVFVRQLYWRDFYTMILWNFPRVVRGNFYEKFDKLKWKKGVGGLGAWKDGRTGFPIIDAGMRQINTTGWMHNRIRMLVASFLVKDLHIDWKVGDKYFCEKLVDIDWGVNNGNWQSVAGTGASALPWFRVMNPWTQTIKFDGECEYIKEWVEELRDVPNDVILGWGGKDGAKYKKENGVDYPLPIVEHDIERDVALKMYRKVN